MQKAAGAHVSHMLYFKTDNIDLLFWDPLAMGHNWAAIAASWWLSDDVQRLVNTAETKVTQPQFMKWFRLKAKPLKQKQWGTKAAQLRLSKGIPLDIWGGRELFSVRMTERHSTARNDAVSLQACDFFMCALLVLSFCMFDMMQAQVFDQLVLDECDCHTQEVKFLMASKNSSLIDAETDELKAERGKLGADMLAGNAYRVAGQNPVGNPAFIAAVKSSMQLGQAAYQGKDKPRNEVKLRQVALVSYKVRTQHESP